MNANLRVLSMMKRAPAAHRELAPFFRENAEDGGFKPGSGGVKYRTPADALSVFPTGEARCIAGGGPVRAPTGTSRFDKTAHFHYNYFLIWCLF